MQHAENKQQTPAQIAKKFKNACVQFLSPPVSSPRDLDTSATRKMEPLATKNEAILAKWSPTSNRKWRTNRCYRKQTTKPCLTEGRTRFREARQFSDIPTAFRDQLMFPSNPLLTYRVLMGVPNQRHPNDPQPESVAFRTEPGTRPRLPRDTFAARQHPRDRPRHGAKTSWPALPPPSPPSTEEKWRHRRNRGRYKLPGAKETQKAATKRKDRESAAEKIPAQARQKTSSRLPPPHQTVATIPI